MGGSISGWWRRERTVALGGFLAVLVGFLGYQWVRLEAVNSRQCQDISVEARISADTLQTQRQNNRALLPKANIEGITHQQLVELTNQREAQERRHQRALEKVARGSCG